MYTVAHMYVCIGVHAYTHTDPHKKCANFFSINDADRV